MVEGRRRAPGQTRIAVTKPDVTRNSKVKKAARPQAKRLQPAPLVLPDAGATLILTVDERLALRRQAHGLSPVVMMGQAGLTDAVMLEMERALRSHGLIKVKAVLSEDRAQREVMAEQITQRLSAALVQQIGKILVLYRPR